MEFVMSPNKILQFHMEINSSMGVDVSPRS